MDESDKLNRLEELKTKLFSREYKTRIKHRDTFSDLNTRDVPDSWDDENKINTNMIYSPENLFKKTSMFKKFFTFSLIFFILTVLYASYVFFFGGNTVSNDNIDISVVGNNFTPGGEELSLVVGVLNKNASSLDLADLVIEYPKSSANNNEDMSGQMERNRISLGTIPAGALKSENVKLVLFGEQGTTRTIKISLEYRIQGSNAIFIKERTYDVVINSTPINISLEAPDSISPNQDINLKVKTTLNSTRPATKILFKVDYPPGFVFTSANPTPSMGNNVWNLGDLAPGSEKDINIIGKMVDVFDGEQKNFRISAGSQSDKDKTEISEVFNSLSHVIEIKKPFIEANLTINSISAKEYSSDSKTPIQGQIIWKNNLDTKVDDLEIRAKITGNVLNKKNINPEQGFYDSANDVIIWDKNYKQDFKEVNPGDTGSIGFSIDPSPTVDGDGVPIINPAIKIEVSISGKQMLDGYTTQDLNNSNSAIVKISSDVGFENKIVYHTGPFKNFGPIPPKVEKETSYTVVWNLSNNTNNISKAVVRSSLPPFVKFLGTFAPESEDFVYNPSTREIVWNTGTIPKGAGVTKALRGVSFQVSISPSLSQINKMPILINGAVLTGHDDFANVDIRVNRGSLSTSVTNDPLFPANGAMVVE